MDKNKTIAKYKSHTHREHIYKIPDTYIGSVGCYRSIGKLIIIEWFSQHYLIPGLYKIVDNNRECMGPIYSPYRF